MHGVRAALLRIAIAGFDQQLHRAAGRAEQLDALRFEEGAGVGYANGQQKRSRHCAAQQRAAKPREQWGGSDHHKLKNKKATRVKQAWLFALECLPNQYIFGGNCMLRRRLYWRLTAADALRLRTEVGFS